VCKIKSLCVEDSYRVDLRSHVAGGIGFQDPIYHHVFSGRPCRISFTTRQQAGARRIFLSLHPDEGMPASFTPT
ncbi:unnamed protein product, partial [Linum tenue]